MLKPKAMYAYLPLIPRLKLLFANKGWAEKMRYGARLATKPWINGDGTEGTGIRDVWEGSQMKALKDKGNPPDVRQLMGLRIFPRRERRRLAFFDRWSAAIREQPQRDMAFLDGRSKSTS
jgi:hypothetical protein